ncbi:MAG: TonB-dependent receptor [Bacteroidota bacterium]
MKNIPALLFLFTLTIQLAIAQQTVRGTVYGDENQPLPGASITVKGTTQGTLANNDGTFRILVPEEEAVLVVSFLGYSTKEVTVDGKTNISITLEPEVKQLDEVVVIGYGTVRKSDLTGAVSTVKVEDNVSRQSNTIDQLLQGRAAGVQVTQNGSAPGSGISVRIRGTNSLRGNNEPLYVIDGVIISSAGEDVAPAGGVGNAGQETQNGLNGLNPRDIESIEVLKDASATAIYGSRGANGVVLITTKKGKSGKAKINGFVTRGFRTVVKKYDVLDGRSYAQYQNEFNLLNGSDVNYHIEGENVYPITSEAGRRVISSTPAQMFNWQDEIYQMGANTTAGGSISGGSEEGNYYLSAGYNDQNGLVDNSRFQSGDLRFNLDRNVGDKLKVEARFSAFYSQSDFAEAGDLIGNNQSFIRNILSFNPLLTEEIDDFTEELGNANPYAWVNDFDDKSVESRYIGSLALTYSLPIKGLKYQIKAGGNVRDKDRRRFYGLTTFQGANANGALQISKLNVKSFQVNNFLRYFRNFKRKHRVSATAGVTYDVRNVENSIYSVEDFVTTQLRTLQPFLGQVITTPLAIQAADQELFSVLARLNYTFDNRYVLTASFRRDGVSKFAPENRFGLFPSFAVAWRLVNESFMENLNAFSDLKIRAGWGQIGNHGIGPYGTLSNYGSNSSILYGTPANGTSVPIVLNNIANPDLTWETTEQLNIGLDFGLADNRITATLDWYDKTTKDLLQNIPIPTSSGFSNLLINRGTISNKGIEAGLNLILIGKEDLNLTIGGNIAFNRTRIESLGIPLDTILVDGSYQPKSFYTGANVSRGNIFKAPANIFIEGEETSLFYGFQTNGIYQTEDTDIVSGAVPGDVRIVDQNQDGLIDDKDRTIIGNPNPDFVYGMNLSFQWKGLSISALINGVFGNDIANGNLIQMGSAEGTFRNIIPSAYHNAWREDKPSTTFPRIGYTEQAAIAINDRIIEDGSYMRLNNVTIGYDIPLKSLVERVNVYVSGQNLYTLTGYSGYNPEVTNFLYTGLINGVDWNGAANAKNILFGLNITF